MTNEEAIKKLENFAKHIEPNEEFIMAIEALKQADGDLISRQALLQKMWNDFYKMEDEHEKEQGFEYIGEKRTLEQNGFECAIKTVSDFPSAEKTAEWILFDEDKNVYECSSCKEPFILMADTPKENNYNYCPNCGAKMKGGKKNEPACRH